MASLRADVGRSGSDPRLTRSCAIVVRRRLWDHGGWRHQVLLTNGAGRSVGSKSVIAATAKSRTGS